MFVIEVKQNPNVVNWFKYKVQKWFHVLFVRFGKGL